MLDPVALQRAVELQRRSYALLRWVASAVDRGFISFDAAHAYGTLPEAALAWISEHHANLPPDARPSLSDLGDFARFFATYLETSFELVREPGQILHSPDNHCFCPMCSWLVDAPRLRTKKIGANDKKRADRRMLRAVEATLGASIPEEDVAPWISDATLRPSIAMVAYGYDLIERVAGRTEGAVTLALWRRFAWTKEGSPRKDFALSAESILEAERLVRRLRT